MPQDQHLRVFRDGNLLFQENLGGREVVVETWDDGNVSVGMVTKTTAAIPVAQPEGDAAPEVDENPDHFEVFKGKDAQWYFRRVAANGKIVHPSEGYKRRKDAVDECHREDKHLAVDLV